MPAAARPPRAATRPPASAPTATITAIFGGHCCRRRCGPSRPAGVEALTLRAVGKTLGVSRTRALPAFRRQVRAPDAVAREGFRMLRLELLEAWEQGGGGGTASRQMGVAYVRFAVDHPAHYRVMFGGFLTGYASDAALAAEGSAAFQVLVDALVAQQQAGLVRATIRSSWPASSGRSSTASPGWRLTASCADRRRTPRRWPNTPSTASAPASRRCRELCGDAC